jgi:ABC-type transport system involved in multi-copper enzyme maturation permease subunit
VSSARPAPSRALALRGLFADAVYQVLDNRVFRVLIGLSLLPILLTFLVGLKEESISLLFGMWTFDYPAMSAMLGEDPRPVAIEWLLDIVIDGFVGNIGMTLSVAATAFFVPRMLEKGAADLVFVKPLSRWTLYISRYVTGLVFVGLLGLFLTTGIYFGLLLVSGYNAPEVLWSSLTLVYLFGMIHAVTMLIGVYTRSTSAAMILGLVFFFGNGCVHKTWQVKDQAGHILVEQMESSSNDPESEAEAHEAKGTTPWIGLVKGVYFALDSVHYILPKTSDATLVTLHIQDAVFGSGRLAIRRKMEQAAMEDFDKDMDDARSRPGDRDGPPDSFNSETLGDSFESQFAWDAEETRYSVWFSILSSMAFTGLMLLLGMWKLRRSDF